MQWLEAHIHNQKTLMGIKYGAGASIIMHILTVRHCVLFLLVQGLLDSFTNKLAIGPTVRADFRRLYPANAKTPTCCPSDDHRTKVTNFVTSARSLWWHIGPYFWPADLTRTANPIVSSDSSILSTKLWLSERANKPYSSCHKVHSKRRGQIATAQPLRRS